MEVEAIIPEPSQSASYGEKYRLTCKANAKEAKPSVTHPLLHKYLTLEWLDINNVPIVSKGSLYVGSVSGFSRTLHFSPLMEGDNRLFRCRVTLKFPGKPKITHSSQYRLMLGTTNLFLGVISNALFFAQMRFLFSSSLILSVAYSCRKTWYDVHAALNCLIYCTIIFRT